MMTNGKDTGAEQASDEIAYKSFYFQDKLVCIVVLRTYEEGYRLSTTFNNGQTVSKVFTDSEIALGTYTASVLSIEDEIKKVS